MAEHNQITESAEDKEFRQKSTRNMFMAALYNSVGMASFFGLLGNMVGMVMKAFSTEAVSKTAATTAEIATGFLGVTPFGWAVTGGLMAVGVVCTYMAQIETTKLTELQQNRQARENAKCLATPNGNVKSLDVEYAQNCRADGKKWQEAAMSTQGQNIHQLH